VIELLLDGKSQAVVAHVLDVCEGTVSRIRASVIKSLRQMLAE
jgi:DNA-directed RNA polymerase specialized sigma subunit